MSEEPPAPDLVELVRRQIEAAQRRDFDALMSFYAADAIWDGSSMGAATFDGAEAIRQNARPVGAEDRFKRGLPTSTSSLTD